MLKLHFYIAKEKTFDESTRQIILVLKKALTTGLTSSFKISLHTTILYEKHWTIT